MDFSGKAVLVTGASRGIGKATARAFLDAGARVAVNGRTEASVAAALVELDAQGRAVAAPGDVATVAGCEAVVKAALEQLGGLDVLVNNAGTFARASMADTDEDVYTYVIDANLKSTFFCSRAALPALKASCGSIVNIASQSGINGYPDTTAYCAAKGAVVNLTRAMALELAPEIRVNSICPGVVETDMTRQGFAVDGDSKAGLLEQAQKYPVKRLGTVEEIAFAALYLASPQAGFITAEALIIDGGQTAGG